MAMGADTRPVRIAILDSGIDQSHPDYAAWKESIVDTRCFSAGNGGIHDVNGHGTFISTLTLNHAPDAQLYIAKVAEHDSTDARTIARAVRHATDDWKVDIIIMSFGFSSRRVPGYDELEAALKRATSKDVLLFAAASNSGANTRRAFPARHSFVICVHSTNADGTPSSFNPPPQDGDNFATIGEAVESSWPVHLCDTAANPLAIAFKSGTSFATPILAGVAATLLQYARAKLGSEEARQMKQHDAMKAVLRAVAVKNKEYDYISLSRHPDNFFGKPEAWRKATISQALWSI